jgi:hypothetical protein
MFENPTFNLNALYNSFAKIACCSVWVDLHVSLCGQQHPKCFFVQCNATNKDLTELSLEILVAHDSSHRNWSIDQEKIQFYILKFQIMKRHSLKHKKQKTIMFNTESRVTILSTWNVTTHFF